MPIEEQIALLEARIQACMVSVAGATEIAEQAATRAEQAAARAELAVLNAETAASASLIASAAASESMTISSDAAIEAAEIMEEIEQIVEEEVVDAGEQVQDEGGSPSECEARADMEQLDGRDGQSQESPIIIKIETRNKPEPTLFKRNNTRFRRGGKA